MVVEEGTRLVLAYLLVSAGVIIIFLVAALVVGWFVGRRHVRRRRQRGEE
jgi:Flp pilus assembly protein TadB